MDKENKKTDSGIVLMEHSYDGIQEYDQKLPNWWLFSLYAAIVFFIMSWLLYYSGGAFRTDQEVLDEKLGHLDEIRASRLAKRMTELNDDVLWDMSRNNQFVEAGKTTYVTYCAACHGTDLSATLAGTKLPGEPLNDAEWKYGGKPMEIIKIIQNGSPDATKGMVAWEPVLGTEKVVEVLAFILSHHEKPAAP